MTSPNLSHFNISKFWPIGADSLKLGRLAEVWQASNGFFLNLKMTQIWRGHCWALYKAMVKLLARPKIFDPGYCTRFNIKTNQNHSLQNSTNKMVYVPTPSMYVYTYFLVFLLSDFILSLHVTQMIIMLAAMKSFSEYQSPT